MLQMKTCNHQYQTGKAIINNPDAPISQQTIRPLSLCEELEFAEFIVGRTIPIQKCINCGEVGS